MYNERIPVKTGSLSLSGEAVGVEAEGLEVTVYAKSADVLIKTDKNVSDDDAFILASGTCVTLGGHFFLKAEEPDVRLLYWKRL